MKICALRLCALVGAILWSFAVAADPVPPAEAFGTLPVQTDCVLSPDGHWLAWLDRTDASPRVVMFDLVGHKVQRIMGPPARSTLRGLRWHDNETLLIFLSETFESQRATQTTRTYSHVIAADIGGGETRMLPQPGLDRFKDWRAHLPQVVGLVAAQTTKPKTVIMASSTECAHCVMEVDTRTGKSDVIKLGNTYTVMWVVDRSGTPVAREDWDWHKQAYRLYALHGNSIRELLRKDDSSHPSVAGLLPDGSAIVMLATNDRAHQAVWALPLDGSPSRLLFEDPDADITSAYTDAYTGAILGVYVSGGKTEVHWLDSVAQGRQDRVQRAFANRQVSVYGWTADGSKTLALVQAPSSPPVYYLVDFSTHRADIAAEEYPKLANVPLGEQQEIRYSARDGTSIPAFLTLPPGKPSGPVPLVVLPHDGPNRRDYPSFDWLVQFLATRGYAVLQPQFRGSTGFGDAFREAGYRQWGGLMQDDVSDGVRAMIDRGIADGRRVAIVGFGYGGYVALAGAAFTPDLYKCAVSIDGITDLPSLMRDEVPLYYGAISTSLSQWKAHIGAPNDSRLAAKSPINSVKSVQAPILVVYGTNAAIPNEQSERMASALKAVGKDVTVEALSSEENWLWQTDTRVQFLHSLEAFLRDHL